MLSAIKISSVFGPILFIVGIWTLFYKEELKNITESYKKNAAVFFLGSVINLIIGLTIIVNFNEWKIQMFILVTLLGWFFFLRGLLILFFPKIIFKAAKMHENASIFFGLLNVIWGLALSYLAFK